jgi:hypothetical protein
VGEKPAEPTYPPKFGANAAHVLSDWLALDQETIDELMKQKIVISRRKCAA